MKNKSEETCSFCLSLKREEKKLKEELSARLRLVAQEVTPGHRLADIGTDHAYLPIYLVEQGICPFVIGSDIAVGPLENGRTNIARKGLEQKIELRLGSGVETLTLADQIDTLSLCGMGGKTIVAILAKGLELGILPVKELILQANTDEHLVRFWLTQHGYRIDQEQYIHERKAGYEIITARYGEVPAYTRQDLVFGPILRQQQTPAWAQKQKDNLTNYKRVLAHIPKDSGKYAYIAQKIKEIEEVLSC